MERKQWFIIAMLSFGLLNYFLMNKIYIKASLNFLQMFPFETESTSVITTTTATNTSPQDPNLSKNVVDTTANPQYTSPQDPNLSKDVVDTTANPPKANNSIKELFQWPEGRIKAPKLYWTFLSYELDVKNR